MRINKFIAQATGLSRRSADRAIEQGRVTINGQAGALGSSVTGQDTVTLDDRPVGVAAAKPLTIILNKPVGYVCSRNGQGSPTVYDLLPLEYHDLKIAGRLDKDSSGLVLLTNDGELANNLTHPRYTKTKLYEIELDQELSPADRAGIERGVKLDDGLSALKLKPLGGGKRWQVRMHEGRNRQIRRTFATRGYRVAALRRTHFGPYQLSQLSPTQQWAIIKL